MFFTGFFKDMDVEFVVLKNLQKKSMCINLRIEEIYNLKILGV